MPSTPQAPTLGRRLLAHFIGAGVYLLLTVIGMIAYGFFYKATGPRVDGMVGGAIIVFLPAAILAFGLLIWTPVWAFMNHKWGPVTPRLAMAVSITLGLLVTVFYCQGGLRCFMTGSSEHLVGWFFVIFAAAGATAHSAIYQRLTINRG